MRIYGLNAPQFDGSAAMITAFTAVADDLLGLFGELAYEVQIEIKGVLDTQWAGLGRTLKLVDTTGARDFSFLDGVTLSVVAVEWDVENTITRVFAGTKASGRFNLDALRRALMAKHRAERQKTATQRLEELMACLSSHGQQIGQDAPTPVCAERVVFPRPSGGGKTTNLKIEIEIIFEILEILFDLLEFQKGGDFSVDPDTGDVTYMDPGGTLWTYDPDAGTWSDGMGGFTDTPWDQGGGLGGAPDGVADGGSDADPPLADPGPRAAAGQDPACGRRRRAHGRDRRARCRGARRRALLPARWLGARGPAAREHGAAHGAR